MRLRSVTPVKVVVPSVRVNPPILVRVPPEMADPLFRNVYPLVPFAFAKLVMVVPVAVRVLPALTARNPEVSFASAVLVIVTLVRATFPDVIV